MAPVSRCDHVDADADAGLVHPDVSETTCQRRVDDTRRVDRFDKREVECVGDVTGQIDGLAEHGWRAAASVRGAPVRRRRGELTAVLQQPGLVTRDARAIRDAVDLGGDFRQVAPRDSTVRPEEAGEVGRGDRCVPQLCRVAEAVGDELADLVPQLRAQLPPSVSSGGPDRDDPQRGSLVSRRDRSHVVAADLPSHA